MFGEDHKCTLVKHGRRHSCRIDEAIQLQVTHHQLNGEAQLAVQISSGCTALLQCFFLYTLVYSMCKCSI